MRRRVDWPPLTTRFIADSTSTPEEYEVRVLDWLSTEYPGYTLTRRQWVRVPNGFWRWLFRRPERGYYVTTEGP